MTVISRDKKWWKEAVVYQIYPASFCDSNGDGVGDLPGITSKLDYIASLGVDVIWICPMYDSPQVDMGYDISNYEDIYAPYGTLQDMETLIKETHARGMKMMLDLVINHTSDQHAWFKESRSSKENPKRDWYIWKPARYSETGERLPPNNWRSNFGVGSAWEWDETTQEYYLHLFATEQPDLNWENPETRDAIYQSSMEFWLKRGVDGFRVDTVNMYSKPQDYPDAPVVDPNTFAQPAGMIYCNGPRMHEFLGEMNDILAKYGAITVGELPNTPDTGKVLQYVSAEAKQLDMVFQFDITELGLGTTHRFETVPHNYTLPQFKGAIDAVQKLIRGTDAWITVFFENHDQPRSVSRLANDSVENRVASAKLLAVLQACLSGTQYVYQGQEIGCVNVPKEGYPPENYLDIDSSLFYKMMVERHGDNKEEIEKAFTAIQHLARDHSRVPIAWNGNAKFGGFSEAAENAGKEVKEPWMKTHPFSGEINVASQLTDKDSVLSFWKDAIKFRKENANITVYADYRTLRENDQNVYTFVKENANGVATAFVVLNFSTEPQSYASPSNEELGLSRSQDAKLAQVLSTHGGKSVGGALAPLEGKVYFVNP
ncbi:Putative Glycoside hydrolase family 13 [[Torrubiella] hemipterigena]|uniref:Alpha-glucosidase n=1 Tax=[Torrubiella] hemipterigena TaxID=1531966 RepID=A0A0A1TGU6_9HYPO|nr:Putative Glycoside hydrolase family 13 [[Torrubiella] hemipterigena]